MRRVNQDTNCDDAHRALLPQYLDEAGDPLGVTDAGALPCETDPLCGLTASGRVGLGDA